MWGKVGGLGYGLDMLIPECDDGNGGLFGTFHRRYDDNREYCIYHEGVQELGFTGL